MVCSGFLHANPKTVLARLCIYHPLAIGMKTSIFHSPTSVSVSVSCQLSPQPPVEETQGMVTGSLNLGPAE